MERGSNLSLSSQEKQLPTPRSDSESPYSTEDETTESETHTSYHYLGWETPLSEILALISSNYTSSTNPPPKDHDNTIAPNISTSFDPNQNWLNTQQDEQEHEIPASFFKLRDPFSWNRIEKGLVTVICCLSTITGAWASAGYSLGVNDMAQEWNVSKIQVTMGFPMFMFGFAFTPMVLSPISEVHGRKSVLLACQTLTVFATLGSALVKNSGGNLVLRLLLGMGTSPAGALTGGMLADCNHAAQRGLPMAFFGSIGLAATGLGPLASGFLVENLGWRWIHWVQLMMNVFCLLFFVVFLKETRGSVLLERKAKILNEWMEQFESKRNAVKRIRWKTKAGDEMQTLSELIKDSVTRPTYFLFTESVVFWFALWASFVWSCLYLFMSSIPYVFSRLKGFSPSHTGLMFLSLILGSFIAQALVTLTEHLLSKSSYLASRNPDPAHPLPEVRLYASCLYAPLLPAGIFLFAFTATSHPVYVPGIAMGLMTLGIYAVYLAVLNYLADTYHKYSSSALAAGSMCRNLLGGVFPIVGEMMYDGVGVQNGSCILAAVGLALCVVPWVLVVWGERIRRRSRFCMELEGKGEVEADT